MVHSGHAAATVSLRRSCCRPCSSAWSACWPRSSTGGSARCPRPSASSSAGRSTQRARELADDFDRELTRPLPRAARRRAQPALAGAWAALAEALDRWRAGARYPQSDPRRSTWPSGATARCELRPFDDAGRAVRARAARPAGPPHLEPVRAQPERQPRRRRPRRPPSRPRRSRPPLPGGRRCCSVVAIGRRPVVDRRARAGDSSGEPAAAGDDDARDATCTMATPRSRPAGVPRPTGVAR